MPSPKLALPIEDEMRNTMGTTSKVWFLVIMLAGPALAQNRLAEPSPAIVGPAYDVSTGYTYLAMPIAGAGQVHLNGLDASGSIAWSPRWGATLDTSYLRTSDIPGIGHQAYLLNTQCGPEFYPFEHRNSRFFVRVLGGSALIDGAVPVGKTGLYHGWLVRPSFTAGGGFEQSISGQFAIRINGDYLHTSFYDSTGAVLPQNNLRLTVSFVIRVKKGAGRVNTAW
jgi:hypothetical protein